jgi:integrase
VYEHFLKSMRKQRRRMIPRRAIRGKGDTFTMRGKAVGCMEDFLATHKEEVRARTLLHFRQILTHFISYAVQEGAAYIRAVDIDLIKGYRTTALGTKKPTTRRLSLRRLKFFFKEAFVRDWLTAPIAEKIIPGSAESGDPKRMTKKQFGRLLEATNHLLSNRMFAY